MASPNQTTAMRVMKVVAGVCLCLLLGCEKPPPRFAEDAKQRNRNPSEKQALSESDDTDASNSTGSSSKVVSVPIVTRALHDQAIRSTVRLTVEPEAGSLHSATGFGSGVIVGRDEAGAVYILTVWHAAKHGIRCVEYFDANSQTHKIQQAPKVIGKSVKRDLALIKASVDSLQVSVVDVAPQSEESPPYGYSVGCSSGRDPTVLGERIIDDKLIRFDGSETRARMWVTDLPQEGGRSGGALLDPQGRLLGIAIKATVNGYYTHADEIRQFLSESDLK